MHWEEMADKICVFVSSSDNTADVFRKVAPSFDKFWPDCPFEKFVGLNSPIEVNSVPGFQPVLSAVRGWHEELSKQILQLPERYRYVLLFLDDFLILSPVRVDRLRRLLDEALRREFDYLRLVPVRRAAIPRITRRIFRNIKEGIEPIDGRSPYYSSLQLALWKRGHLADVLALGGKDIWTFEHLRIAGAPHFAVVQDPPIAYIHVVEKGRWQPFAEALFRRLNLPFTPGKRGVLGPLATLSIWVNRIKFDIFGYGVVRLKRFLRSRTRPDTKCDGDLKRA